jgi:hypothetical protein
MSKHDRLEQERRKTEKLLERLGYYDAKRRHGKVRPVAFPDLRIEQKVAPTSDKIGNGFARPALPADAKVFPVGQSHKQGYVLLTENAIKNELQYYGGKKT